MRTQGVQLEEDVGQGVLEGLGRIARVAAQRLLVGAAVQELDDASWRRHMVALVGAQRLQGEKTLPQISPMHIKVSYSTTVTQQLDDAGWWCHTIAQMFLSVCTAGLLALSCKSDCRLLVMQITEKSNMITYVSSVSVEPLQLRMQTSACCSRAAASC